MPEFTEADREQMHEALDELLATAEHRRLARSRAQLKLKSDANNWRAESARRQRMGIERYYP